MIISGCSTMNKNIRALVRMFDNIEITNHL